MEAAFHTFVTSYFLTEVCYQDYFVNLNFSNIDCFKLLLSKGLGYGIILGSVVVKMPQIIKVFKAGSVEGLSLLSLLLELVALTVNVSYCIVRKFPFSTWGEGCFLIAQTSILIMQIFYYRNLLLLLTTFLPFSSCIFLYLISDYCSIDVLSKLTMASMPIVAVSKIAQIAANYSNGHTGQLSFVTVFLIFAGSVARVFTTVQETSDFILLITYIVTSTLNGLVVAQILYYWNVIPPTKSKKEE